MIDLDTFRASMQRLAAAVTVVATNRDGDWAGLTASAVTSLTGEPPTLLANVNRDSHCHPVIVAAERFSVNVLARDQEEIAGVFAGFTGLEGGARFEVGDWTLGDLDVPILGGSLVSFECVLEERHARSTHDILIGRIERAHLPDVDIDPLLYVNRTFGGFTG